MYWQSQQQWSNFQDLNLNMMQVYGHHWDFEPNNPMIEGGFKDGIGSYSSQVNGLLDNWGYYIHPRSLYLEREKLLRPGYGQRSTYQAEYTSSQLTGGSIRPGYGFTGYNGQA